MKTYAELLEDMCDAESDDFIGRMDPATRRAWQTIELFESRAGFDHWWDEISETTKNELFKELRKVLA